MGKCQIITSSQLKLSHLLFIFLIVVSCSKDKFFSSALNEEQAISQEKLAWTEKAITTLVGPSLTAKFDIVELTNRYSKEQIAELLINSKEFGDTVLDFNLYFLGFKPTSVLESTHEYRYSSYLILNWPHAVSAAKAIINNTDYFTLFDQEQFYHFLLLGRKSSDQINNLATSEKLINDFMWEIIKTLQAKPLADACKYFYSDEFNEKQSKATNDIEYPFRDILTADLIDPESYCEAYQEDVEAEIKEVFATSKSKLATKGEIIAHFITVKDKSIPQFFKTLRELYSQQDQTVNSVADIQSFTAQRFGLNKYNSALNIQNFWVLFPNSSTNYNRKRAAYILKTYFCDDLTPVNLAFENTTHGESAHASEPGCQACHYKLDPMAGYFRDYGIFGFDFSNYQGLIFDDNAAVTKDKHQEYLNNWRDKKTGTWTIGFMRSPQQKTFEGGNDLKSLFQFIRNAPETKQCLTRRMAEYFLGQNQMVNGEWIDYLAKKFMTVKDNTPSSAQVFKEITKELVLSETFNIINPEPDKCYGQKPPEKPDSSLPCEISYVIKKNCMGCHNTNNQNGNLNLSVWIENTTEQGYFDHKNEMGKQLLPTESFQRIVDRISSNDKTLLMPLNKDMPDTERQKFYKWLNKQLEQKKSGSEK